MTTEEKTIPIGDIPKIQFEINNDELKSCIKELNFLIKTQQKTISKMKKDMESRATQGNVVESLIIINSGIEVDPSLVKLLKSKQTANDTNPLRNASMTLAKKINQISQCLPILLNNIKNLDKKISLVDQQTKSIINQKVSVLQEQIDQFKTQQNNENVNLSEKLELTISEYSNKLREVQTKTLWQINDCKVKIEDRVSEQMVKDAMKQLQGKLTTKIKQTVLKGNIDPERINKIEQKASKNQKEFAVQMTQNNFKIQKLQDYIQAALLTKQSFSQQKLEIEKRFAISNANLSDILKRTKICEIGIQEYKQPVKILKQHKEEAQKELKRVNEVLANLKITEDFQKLLQTINPHKICQLDTNIQNLQISQLKMSKQFDALKRDVERIRTKNEFVGVITPNSDKNQRFDKEQISKLISEFFINNQFAKKIQNIEAQILETKTYNQLINDINKRLARLQKQSQYHNVIYEMKGLEEYIKKEILITTNRMNQLQLMLIEQKKKRPLSSHKPSASDGKLASSISYKKLMPVNCISCYPGGQTFPSASESRKSLGKRY